MSSHLTLQYTIYVFLETCLRHLESSHPSESLSIYSRDSVPRIVSLDISLDIPLDISLDIPLDSP